MPLLDYDDFYPWGKNISPLYPTCAEFTPPYFAIRQIDKLRFCQQIPLFLCGIRYRMISSEHSQRLTDAGESATMKAQRGLYPLAGAVTFLCGLCMLSRQSF